MRLAMLAALCAVCAFGQPLSFGVKAGTPLNNAFRTRSSSGYFADKQSYTVGPTVELHLPFRLSVELDALYKPLEYGSATSARWIDAGSDGASQEIVNTSMSTTGRSLEFPLLLKYHAWSGPVKPYIGTGLSWRHAGGLKQIAISTGQSKGLLTRTETDSPTELHNSWTTGIVFSGGVELRLPLLRVSPELRYTRWGTTSFKSEAGGLLSQSNQVEFLIGVTF